MDRLEPGMKESDLGELLMLEGQFPSVVTIAASGERFAKANLYPTHKTVKRGDPLSLTVGYKGGLSSRSAFVIEDEKDLPDGQGDYLSRVVIPYFQAVISWLENCQIGRLAADLYADIEAVLPKADYHWHLNPGHYMADEEWLASPFYQGSSVPLKSGMIFQIDIIPSVPGYAGVSAEEAVALADEALQKDLERAYPELWQRICQRRAYLIDELKIELSPELLPLSNTVAYLRPFLLAKDKALRVKGDLLD